MQGFEIRSVVHLLRPLGRVAADLDALREGLAEVADTSLFHHVPLARLRRAAEDTAPADDFSAWVLGVVQDREVAERLAFAAQSASHDAAELRAALLAALDALPVAARRARAAPAEGAFSFLAAESVPLSTGLSAEDPAALMRLLAVSDASAWFYHLVEEPWFEPDGPTLYRWLREHGAHELAERLEREAASGLSIEQVRSRVVRSWRRGGLAKRIAEAAARPETVRRVTARATVAGLARRLARGNED